MTDAYDPEDLIDDVVVLIVAAGEGTRLGSSRPKAFVGLAGKTLLAHSLATFEQHEAVDSIVLVVPEDWVEPAAIMVDDLGCDRVSSIEVGGSSRAASVLAGLAAVSSRRQTAVLVHDAARPIVADDLIERVLAPLAEGHDAVVPSLPVHDTVKRIVAGGSGVVAETLPRGELRLAQTPQACRASVLRAALAGLAADGLAAITDCAHAIELAGGRTVCVEGDVRSRKVTTVDDLRAIEAELGWVAPTSAAPTSEEAAEDLRDVEEPEDLEPLDADDLGADPADERAATPAARAVEAPE